MKEKEWARSDAEGLNKNWLGIIPSRICSQPIRGPSAKGHSDRPAVDPLIRRTRQVTRRKLPAEEEKRIVLEKIRGEVAVSTE